MSRRTSPVAALALVLVAGVALPALAAGDDWSIFRGDPQLTGRAGGSLPADLQPLWTFQAGDAIESSAVIHAGTVYVASMDGHLYALDLAAGKLQWKYQATDAIKSSPSVHGDTVYLGDEGGTFHALDRRTGGPRWTFKTGAAIASSANFAGGRVIFGSQDDHLYGLDPKDGSLAWKVETEGYVFGTPSVLPDEAGGTVISAGCDGYLRLVRAKDGEVIRKVDLAAYVGASPAVAGRRAYVGTFENQVLGVDLDGGTVLWRYENPERHFPFYSSAAMAAELLVVGGRDKLVHALRPDSGELAWKFEAGARVDSSPVLVGKRVLVATTAGLLAALDLESGEPVWKFDSGTGFLGSPAVAGGRLVIGDLDGLVYCFGAKGKGGSQ
jgi:outer membrane protein assembly factor BamB